ncbi:MAG: tetratricopeptide repeat protein [Dysgonomonas sp.]|nr:tetratricopeptide repeat protein [Dysgonomonas sp.]
MKYISLLLLPFLFSSCLSGIKIGIIGLIVIFGVMFLLFAIMFFLIARRRKQGDKSLVKFNNDIYIALNKLDTPQQKVNMLNNLIDRINNDAKYAKDPEWRDKVLVKAYMHLATIYYKTGDDIETLNACTKIVELDPNDGMAHYNRGSIYSNMGMYEKALQDLNSTIELLPDYASAFNNRGLVHEKMEHYTEALSDFDEAIRLEGSAIAYYNRGNTHYELEEYTKALEDYNTALEALDPINQSGLKDEIEMSIKAINIKIQESNTEKDR